MKLKDYIGKEELDRILAAKSVNEQEDDHIIDKENVIKSPEKKGGLVKNKKNPPLMTIAPHNIYSGEEMAVMDIPDIPCYTEGILRAKGKATLVAREKMAKSFFVMQWGMCIASGMDWMGYKVTQANVLYINFEISQEKMLERVQDLKELLGYDLSRFHTVTVPEGMSLDKGNEELIAVLEDCRKQKGFTPDVLIIDPRRQAMQGDENQSEVVRQFCMNLNTVMDKYNMAVIVVHHVSKGTKGAGRGHSGWDGWVDSIIHIDAKSWQGEVPSLERFLSIRGRDLDVENLGVKFNYPLYEVAPNVNKEKKQKTAAAREFILNRLSNGENLLQQLRVDAMKEDHTPYAFQNAIQELKDDKLIDEFKATGKGNRKLLKLKSGS